MKNEKENRKSLDHLSVAKGNLREVANTESEAMQQAISQFAIAHALIDIAQSLRTIAEAAHFDAVSKSLEGIQPLDR